MRTRALISMISILTFVFVITVSSGAMAMTIDLFDWAFKVNENTYPALGDTGWDPWDPSVPVPVTPYAPSNLPATFDYSSFDWYSGLGTITVSGFGIGTNSFHAFFDHEIDEVDNTYFNEYGAVSGAPAAGQSWEIDEPGYAFGDIYSNFLAGSLDNSNGVPGAPFDDVSMAMGWDFVLGTGESALITLALSDVAPASGFYLRHTDPDSPDSDASVYFSSSLNIRGPQAVPEPGTLMLMVVAMVTLVVASRSRRWRRD